WTRLPGSGFDEVNLPCLLRNGQAFRWVQTSAGEWTSTVHGRLVTLRQQLPDRDPSTGIFCLPQLSTPACRNLAGAETETAYDTEQMAAWLVDYFQLGTRLAPLYDQWRRADPAHFAAKAPHYPGIRMLRQDPLENVLSFICSSNNAIPRIATMVQTLARLYGSPVGRVPTHPETVFYAFPTLLQLAHEAPAAMEVRLRQHGFGYRAKFIAATVQALLAHEQAYTADRRPPKACPPHEVPVGSRYLTSLRQQPREDARAALMALPGVGAKVADCICLMSLDQADRIPVDTHVWQIATRDYGLFRDDAALPKTLTPRVYDQIGQHFGALFGPYAGWAHTVLFAADLR
ncbi:DNA glycosylase, partial [Caulochytrium protostelioides]